MRKTKFASGLQIPFSVLKIFYKEISFFGNHVSLTVICLPVYSTVVFFRLYTLLLSASFYKKKLHSQQSRNARC